MNIVDFEDLLQAARQHREAQQLLFVFAGAELPADADPEQRERFAAGDGGELTPLMCVDKAAGALASFDALCAEAAQSGPPWAIVFTAALSGRDGQPPSTADIDAALQHMVDSIKAGRLEGMLPFNRHGEPVHLA